MNREDNPREWLHYAENDQRAAQTLFESGEYEARTFHCQQAVEKFLKAVIVKQTGKRPVHTHDLGALLEKISGIEVPENIARPVSDVDSYYIGGRYPLDVVDPGYFKEPLAESAIKRMNEVLEWFSTKINFESVSKSS